VLISTFPKIVLFALSLVSRKMAATVPRKMTLNIKNLLMCYPDGTPSEQILDLYKVCIHMYTLVKSRRMMRWAGHVARMGGGEVCTGCWWGRLRERDHWEDPDVDGKIILGGIFRKWEGIVGTGWSGLRIGTDGGHL
jgi:hypothetical protein